MLRRRDHDRGSPARHARGLTRPARAPWAHSNTRRSMPAGRQSKGLLEGDTRAPRAPAAARAAAAAGHGRRRCAEQESSTGSWTRFSLARRVSAARSGADHPPAGDTGARRAAARGSAAGGLAADRDDRACRASCWACVRQGLRAITLADGLGDFPRVFPGDLSRHGCCRRAGRAPGYRTRAAG